MSEVTYRPARRADSRAVFDLFLETVMDLSDRHGLGLPPLEGPNAFEERWIERKPLFDHMARHAESWWLAEQDGRIVGHARTFFRSGLRELTEFFVRPSVQARGIGKELLARAFPAAGADRRLILATIDARALTRYIKLGVKPRFGVWFFARKAEPRAVASDLEFERLGTTLTPAQLDELAAIDEELLTIRRDPELQWVAAHRTGFVARRKGRAVGYGFVAKRTGPFAALDAADQPAIWAHAETLFAPTGGEFGLVVPLVNETAIDYAMANGFKLDGLGGHFLSDRPFGRFDRYAFTAPTFFL